MTDQKYKDLMNGGWSYPKKESTDPEEVKKVVDKYLTDNKIDSETINKKITDGVSKIVADAPEDFDTLKEMSDWISQHSDSAAAMNSDILDNKSGIESLQKDKANATDVESNTNKIKTLDENKVGIIPSTASTNVDFNNIRGLKDDDGVTTLQFFKDKNWVAQITDSTKAVNNNTNAIVDINDNLSSEISRAKEADEILKSRVDVITSLPEGSTTGDAELQDIRVKADGTTATSAGNAVREQISELKSDLNNHTRVLDDKVFNLTTVDLSNSEFGYYDFNGIFQSSEYSKCISVDCDGNSVFELTLDVTANARYAIIFTDIFNNVISREIIGENDTTRVTNKIVYAPSDTKHALVTWDVTEGSRIPSVFMGVKNVIKRIKTLPYIIPWTRRGYYNEQGNVENNNYSYYCEIDTSEYRNNEVIVKGYVFGDARCLFRTCDINGNIIENYYRGINSGEPTYELFETTFLIPSNCYSIKMTSMNENYPCSGVFAIENNEIDISNYSLSPFKDLKFVAYGDSTTEIGHWVELVQEELQFKTALNLGWGGSMLATESLDPQFSVFSIWPGAWDDRIAEIPNDTDVITIMFGTNDCGYGNALNGDLGSIDSTDTKYYYGAYNYLISKLYEKNPYMKIFLCTSAYTGEEARVEGFHEHLDLCREATINIARKYNLPLIEMRENGINELNRTFYHEDSSHPNVLGGKQFARPIIAKLKSFYYGL